MDSVTSASLSCSRASAHVSQDRLGEHGRRYTSGQRVGGVLVCLGEVATNGLRPRLGLFARHRRGVQLGHWTAYRVHRGRAATKSAGYFPVAGVGGPFAFGCDELPHLLAAQMPAFQVQPKGDVVAFLVGGEFPHHLRAWNA
jgi:hypothetical protein